MRTTPILLAIATVALTAACTGGSPDDTTDTTPVVPGGPGDIQNPNEPTNPDTQPPPPEAFDVLDQRVVDYNAALRTATLKLLRRLPTLQEIKDVEAGGQAAYEAQIDAMFETPEFSQRMVKWWQDIMRMGGGNGDDRNTAPTFAAQLIVEGRPFTELLTATTGNCPTFDGTAFQSADCQSGAPVQAGVLTNPGVMRQFYGNLAFRRARWVQEIFACKEFPADKGTDQKIGDATYFGKFPFESLSNDPVGFQDVKGAVCANCHNVINRVAPLLANFDENGMWQTDYAVLTPVGTELQPTVIGDYLEGTTETAWRFGKPAATLADLGQVMSQDDEVNGCTVTRAWNFVMSKEDVVSAGAIVPAEVIQAFTTQYKTNFNLKEVLKSMFKGEDFVKF